MLVKYFVSDESGNDFAESINKWIKEENIELVNVSYSVTEEIIEASYGRSGSYNKPTHRALVMYKEKSNVAISDPIPSQESSRRPQVFSFSPRTDK